jgi:plasminogen activator inhibitor 1 RNA-binding protein
VEGEGDAVAEENTPQTPAVEADNGGWDTPVVSATDTIVPTTAVPESEVQAEPEEVQKSYDEFLAERAQAALAMGLGKKEGRVVNAETLEGKAFRREAAEDVFFAGKVSPIDFVFESELISWVV